MATNPDKINVLLTDIKNTSPDDPGGKSRISFLQGSLSAELTTLIHNAVTENAAATRVSTTELGKSGTSIVGGIKELTNAFTQASLDLKEASSQSSKVASRLNTFTFVLAVATVITTAAVCWQAWESKRQADVAERVLKSQEANRIVGPSQTGTATSPNTLPPKP